MDHSASLLLEKLLGFELRRKLRETAPIELRKKRPGPKVVVLPDLGEVAVRPSEVHRGHWLRFEADGFWEDCTEEQDALCNNG